MSRFIENNVVTIIIGIHIVALFCLASAVADAGKIANVLKKEVVKFLKPPNQLKKGN